MRRPVLLAWFMLCAGALRAGDAVFAITDVTIITGTGTTITGGTLLVRNGMIEAAGENVALPDGVRTVSEKGKVVIPGLVAADTLLAAAVRDDERSVCADIVAIDGFDYFAPYHDQLASGTTCAYVSPGARRLVPGQGSIVRLGAPPEGAVLAASAAYEAVLTGDALGPPGLFTPENYPLPDQPFPHQEPQLPGTRSSQLAEFRRVLGGEDGLAARLKAAGLPLRVRADEEREIRAALECAAEHGLDLVIVGGRQAGALAAEIKRAGAAVVWRSSFAARQRDLRDPAPNRLRLVVEDGAAAALAAADVPVALAPWGTDGASLLAAAAFAVAQGFPRDRALAAVTSDAARIIGAAQHAGTIEPGRAADFVLLTGMPFDAGAKVARTYVGGKVVYSHDALLKEEQAGDLLLKGALVLTGDGGRFPQTDVMVGGGGIIAMGPNLRAPENAQVIDLQGKVLIPGLIDIASRLGTYYVGAVEDAVPSFAGGVTIELSLAEILRHDDPVFGASAAAGVLGLCIRDGGGSLVSGTGAFVIPGALRDDFVVRPFACLDIDVSGGARRARIEELKALLAGLARYEQVRGRYDDALDDYRHRKPRDTENRLKEPVPPRPSALNELLLKARRREVPLFVRAERGDEITAVVNALADAGGFECALVGAEGVERADPTVEARISGVVLTPPFRRRVDSAWRHLPEVLERRGIPFALGSGGALGSLHLRFHAADAVHSGLSADTALRAVTSVPARMLGLAGRLGTVAVGREAHLVVLDGEPFAPGSRVEMVFVRGVRVHVGEGE